MPPINRALIMADIVGYSKMSQQKQFESVEYLLNTWMDASPSAGGITLPTGDGFIGVLPPHNGGAPVNLLDFIVEVLGSALDGSHSFQVRFGLHFGLCHPVLIGEKRIDFSADSPNNFLGYSLNYLARLVGCAGPGQIIASDSFVSSLEPTIHVAPHYHIWRDAFVAAFKGDDVSFGFDGKSEIRPSMRGGQNVAEDKRLVHSLVLERNGVKFGAVSVPHDSVFYTGNNNHHDRLAVNRTNFQRVSDVELFQLYRSEERIPVVFDPPFFTRLPFKLLYVRGEDGQFAPVMQDETQVDWRISTDWVEDVFGELTQNDTLCCLTGFNRVSSPSGFEVRMSYAKCTYKDALATTISPDRCPDGALSSSLRRDRLREREAQRAAYTLPQLDSPNLTPDIGVTAIVFSGDGFPIVQRRANKNLHSNIDTESASVSGGVDWKDWDDLSIDLKIPTKSGEERIVTHHEMRMLCGAGRKVKDLLPTDRAILREAAEEIGLFPSEIRMIELVGIAREFRRLGKPEFFYLIWTNLTLGAVAKEADLYATYAWEYGGTLEATTHYPALPSSLQQQRFYFSNLVADQRFNDTTRLAFYFLLRKVAAEGKPLSNTYSVSPRP